MERTAAGDKVEQDGIWLLPDEIIHHILACMKSPKEAAKTIFLSKRWARLWLSYPALEFNGRQFPSREAQQSFATTVLNKFLESDGAPPAEAVRVTMDWLGMGPKPCSAFLDSVFECISKDSPREIYITTSSFDEVLKLDDFNFHQNAYIMADDQNSNNPFAGLGRSLKELHLHSVSFGDDRILNSMISGASLLETLTLVA
ncbi:F-box/FBD/LRR-repeat protein At5g44980 [Linum perenne]